MRTSRPRYYDPELCRLIYAKEHKPDNTARILVGVAALFLLCLVVTR